MVNDGKARWSALVSRMCCIAPPPPTVDGEERTFEHGVCEVVRAPNGDLVCHMVVTVPRNASAKRRHVEVARVIPHGDVSKVRGRHPTAASTSQSVFTSIHAEPALAAALSTASAAAPRLHAPSSPDHCHSLHRTRDIVRSLDNALSSCVSYSPPASESSASSYTDERGARTTLTALSSRMLRLPQLVPELMRPSRASNVVMFTNSVYWTSPLKDGAATKTVAGDSPLGSKEPSRDVAAGSIDAMLFDCSARLAETRELMCGGLTPTADLLSHCAGGDGRLEAQLDDVILYGEGLVMGKYRLQGPSERRVGNTQVVQFAVHARGDSADSAGASASPPSSSEPTLAIRFFRDRRLFENERQLYRDSARAKALPSVEAIVGNDDGTVRDPFGSSLPPFIVMARGEPMHVWALTRHDQAVACMEALVRVTGAMLAVHSAGLVHGKLRPSCALWMARERQWVVTDFTRAVPTGGKMSIEAATSAYDAPELVQARLRNTTEVTAATSADVWSLGAIAYELLTGSQIFEHDDGSGRMARVMMGQAKLPWEAMDPDALRLHLSRLGFMSHGIMSMLSRDPKRRPRLVTVYQSWRRSMVNLIVTRRTRRGANTR